MTNKLIGVGTILLLASLLVLPDFLVSYLVGVRRASGLPAWDQYCIFWCSQRPEADVFYDRIYYGTIVQHYMVVASIVFIWLGLKVKDRGRMGTLTLQLVGLIWVILLGVRIITYQNLQR